MTQIFNHSEFMVKYYHDSTYILFNYQIEFLIYMIYKASLDDFLIHVYIQRTKNKIFKEIQQSQVEN